jgi:hypothetical protein
MNRATAAIALGSNLPSPFGDPEANLREALRRLANLGHVTAISTFHATDPVGYLDQPRFLNAIAPTPPPKVPASSTWTYSSTPTPMPQAKSFRPPN